MKNITFLIGVGLLVSGCASQVKHDPAIYTLAEGVKSISASWEQLAKIKAASNVKEVEQYAYDKSRLTPVWIQELNLLNDFNGSLEDFIRMISAVGGLKQPQIDVPNRGKVIPVSIGKGKRELISFVADAGQQAVDGAVVMPRIADNLILVKFNNGLEYERKR